MHLYTFFEEWVSRFHQTLRRVHGTKMFKKPCSRIRPNGYISFPFELKDILPGTALKYSHRLRLQ